MNKVPSLIWSKTPKAAQVNVIREANGETRLDIPFANDNRRMLDNITEAKADWDGENKMWITETTEEEFNAMVQIFNYRYMLRSTYFENEGVAV